MESPLYLILASLAGLTLGLLVCSWYQRRQRYARLRHLEDQLSLKSMEVESLTLDLTAAQQRAERLARAQTDTLNQFQKTRERLASLRTVNNLLHQQLSSEKRGNTDTGKPRKVTPLDQDNF